MMKTMGAEGGDELVTLDAQRNRNGNNNFDIFCNMLTVSMLDTKWIDSRTNTDFYTTPVVIVI